MVSALPDVPLLHPDREVVAHALLVAGERMAGAFGGSDPAARAGKLAWTVQQLAAHLATGAAEYLAMLTGGPTNLTHLDRREEVGAANIAAEASTPVAELVERLRAAVGEMARVVRSTGVADVPFYAATLPIELVGAVFLGELLVHGHDLARLPVPDDEAAIAAGGAMAILPVLLVPGTEPRRIRLGFEVRGHGAVVVAVEGDDATLEAGPAPADVTIGGRPAPFLLTSYQRISPLGPMLRRQLSIGGRPWKLAALRTRFAGA